LSADPLQIAGAAGLALAGVIAPAAEAGVYRYQDEYVLGTRMNLVLVASDEAAALTAARAARSEIDRLDGIFNSRRPGSELLALNGADRMAVSPELFKVVSLAEAWRERTGGAFDGRLGEPLRLWREARDAPPDAASLRRVLAARGPLELDPATRTIVRYRGAVLALDGIAKGYIVDRALEAGRAVPGVGGMLVDIGGDMRCWGKAPDGAGWTVGVSDPLRPADNADCVAIAHLSKAAIATSGRGPRDRLIGGQRYSTTLWPKTGRPVSHNAGATVVAACAAEADALAGAFLVMPAEDAVALADTLPGVSVRVTTAKGEVHVSKTWRTIATEPPARLIRTQSPGVRSSTIPVERRWGGDWALEMVYIAPDRQAETRRNPDFRTPYMAMWITDTAFKPVRTITMVGKDPEWQRDNFIWWNNYKAQARKMVELRSEATALSGRYSLFWRGIDDEWDPLPIGEYILHIETSQERGKHTYRTVKLSIGREPFQLVLPPTPEGGGLRISFGFKR
jgi:FAD:protein FMN transferase